MSDRDRTRAAAAEAICGAVMLICGVLFNRLGGGILDVVGLVLLVFGLGGLGHAVLLGLGLAHIPGSEGKGVEREGDDAGQ